MDRVTSRLSLDEFGSARHAKDLSAGRYELQYTDSTHLDANVWVRLGYVDVRANPLLPAFEGSERYFEFAPSIEGLPDRDARRGGSSAPAAGEGSGNEANVRVVKDTMALALGRLGLLTPEVSPAMVARLRALDAEEGVVIVPDTNALHNGAVHWLLKALRRPSVWLLPVVASLTTIQSRDALVKNQVNKRQLKNLSQVLRSRGLVNGALGLLQRYRGRYQVVEIDPSLLRYQKTSTASGDPDQSDVLEDRLIIEAIHGVLRSMRSRTARRVVTSDVNIARVLDAEGIETLFVPTIVLPEDPIPCLRFDALARGFVGAPLKALLWEFAHAFGSVRLVNDTGIQITRLDCYWPGKSPDEWRSETLECSSDEQADHADASAPGVGVASKVAAAARDEATSDAAQGVSETEAVNALAQTAAPTQRGRPIATGGASAAEEKNPKKGDAPAKAARPTLRRTAKSNGANEISVALPRASFPQALRLLGATRRIEGGTASEITATLGEGSMTVDTARRAIEIMRRVGLVRLDGDRFVTTGEAEAVNTALKTGDLDTIAGVMTRFEPYRVLTEALERGFVERSQVVEVLVAALGPVGSYEAERLPRFAILLGQAWTSGDRIRGGARRPTDRDASDAFERSFLATANAGIARVADLLPNFCLATGMSPWAAKRQMEKFVANKLLPDYKFQPAAGGKPVIGDEVLTGSLDDVGTTPVIIDRLHLGERPVFTIEGPLR